MELEKAEQFFRDYLSDVELEKKGEYLRGKYFYKNGNIVMERTLNLYVNYDIWKDLSSLFGLEKNDIESLIKKLVIEKFNITVYRVSYVYKWMSSFEYLNKIKDRKYSIKMQKVKERKYNV